MSDTPKTEAWLPIAAYEGLYEVSDMGNVRRLYKSRPPRVLRPGNRVKGYQGVTLSNKTSRSYFVHRLVAAAFLPNPDSIPTVNHKDGVTSNNKVQNLEWMSSRDNTRHAYIVLGRNLASKKQCSRGHIRTLENTEYHKRTVVVSPVCKICRLGGQRSRYARKKQAA